MPTDRSVPASEALSILSKGNGWSGMRVDGTLKFSERDFPQLRLPVNLNVEVLDLTACPEFKELPQGLSCFELNLANTKIREVPDDLHVESILNLPNCSVLRTLPRGLTVGTLNVRGCRNLVELPEGLDVWFLDMTGCWGFNRWPMMAKIRSGRLVLRGCTALTTLPDYLGQLAALNVRDCPSLRSLPETLRVSGWIDVAQSGLADSKQMPLSLKGVDVRWQGVRIEERIFLHPESITIDEILEEKNAERRRVLIDRFGVSRFMRDSGSTVLDEDRDPGGKRQLLFVDLKDDEPLVTLSCFCPSTSRQYFLRVPPTVKTCHQAAAWIAGFDDPADYQPILET